MKKHSVRYTGFYLTYMRCIEGPFKWAIHHNDRLFFEAFLEENDQLWRTKEEAIECIDNWLYNYAKSC